jgi:hypothetical protein
MSAIKNHEDRIAEYSFVPAIEDHVLEYVFEITELREALKGEQECNVRLDADWQRCMKEKSELQAKLSATEAQKFTVHERSFIYDTHGRCLPTLTLAFNPDDWGSRDNFAAPVAPAQPVNELVEALEHAVEIAEGKRDGTWDDLLQYRATIAHAKLDKLAALSEQADLYSEFTKAAQPTLEKLREYVLKHAPDYPGIEKAEPWEQLYALVTTLEGIKAANEDLHKLLAQPLTKEQVQPAKYGSPNNKIRRDYDRVLTKSSAFYLDPISKKWIFQEDGLYSVGGKIINAKNGDVLAASGEQVQQLTKEQVQPAQGLNPLWKETHPDKLIEPAQGEREQIIRKLKRDVQWVPGKHYVTQLEDIMDEAAALLQSNAERVPLTPAQRVDIADACANLDYDDNFLGDLGKIIDLVEAAHGITKGQQ